ncbi:MAG: PD40 domain-containing protein, partial [Armatimonadetes bacterium]|nr:PD40 domain-containing protein [Armatimonadota bacterium]
MKNLRAFVVVVLAVPLLPGCGRDNATVGKKVDTKIAFVSERNGNEEIYVMNMDGTGQRRLTNNPAVDSSPSFSPDGTKIAFSSTRDGDFEIYVMNADGTGQTNLTNSAAIDGNPSFSPDGSKIAFSSDRSGNQEVYVMNVDGTGLTRL